MKTNILDEMGNKPNRSKNIEYVINNECWECISHFNSKGYPKVVRNKVQYRMNRYVYGLYKGDIPEGMVVMHTCDNPSCINPDHLEIGTQQDNIRDRHNKGRSNGKNNKPINDKYARTGKKQLTKSQLTEIKNMLRKNKSVKEIMEKFNISKSSVYSIREKLEN